MVSFAWWGGDWLWGFADLSDNVMSILCEIGCNEI